MNPSEYFVEVIIHQVLDMVRAEINYLADPTSRSSASELLRPTQRRALSWYSQEADHTTSIQLPLTRRYSHVGNGRECRRRR